MTFKEAIEKFAEWKSIRFDRASTTYVWELQRFYKFINKEIGEIAIDDIIKYQAFLKKNRADNTQAIAAYAMRGFFAFTNKRNITNIDISEISAPRIEQKVPVYVVQADFEKLCGVAQYISPMLLMAIRVLWFTGVRVSELCDMEVAQVDLIESCATISKTRKSFKPKQVFWDEETNELIRGVLLADPGRKFLFQSPKGGRMSTRQIERWIAQLRSKAGIEKHITPHSFRHGATKEWLDQKIDLPAIKDLLGHEHLMSVEKYTKRLNEDIKEIGREAVRRRSAKMKYKIGDLLRSG